jgi:hypothetical protein
MGGDYILHPADFAWSRFRNESMLVAAETYSEGCRPVAGPGSTECLPEIAGPGLGGNLYSDSLAVDAVCCELLSGCIPGYQRKKQGIWELKGSVVRFLVGEYASFSTIGPRNPDDRTGKNRELSRN